MSIEQQPGPPQPEDEFGFSEKERLWDRASHERLMEFLESETTTIHRVEESSNNYGEFLFVTVSRPGSQRRILVTFWGAGYHEYRERWLTDEWHWYRANPFPETLEQQLEREEVKQQLSQRIESIKLNSSEQTQTRRGQMFEILADLTDEDGAYSEMQDLDDLAGDWWDEEI